MPIIDAAPAKATSSRYGWQWRTLHQAALCLNFAGLDAALIAVLWQETLARAAKVPLVWPLRLCLFCAVWATYLTDRAADAAPIDRIRPAKELWTAPRKRFAIRHRRLISVAATVVALSGLVAALRLPRVLFSAGVVLAAMVIIYLIAAQCWRNKIRMPFPREWAVAILFAYGCMLNLFAHLRSPWHVAPLFLLFSGLCLLDLCLLEVWEWEANPIAQQPSQSAFLVAKRFGLATGCLIIGAAVSVFLRWIPWSFGATTSVAAAFWLGLARCRHRISPDLLTLVVDCGLLAPLLFWQ